jgi:hypothetical protein
MGTKSRRPNGLFLVIDRKNEKGLIRWVDELESRKIPAVILLDEYMVDAHSSLVKNIAQRGFEICCSYSDAPFWDESHESQLEIMTRIRDKWRTRLDIDLNVFGSKYFAYTEDTLKIADALGVKYILARGTAGRVSAGGIPTENHFRQQRSLKKTWNRLSLR